MYINNYEYYCTFVASLFPFWHLLRLIPFRAAPWLVLPMFTECVFVLSALQIKNLFTFNCLSQVDRRKRIIKTGTLRSPDIETTVQYSMEKHNSCYSAYLANVKSQPTDILNISFPSEYLSMDVKEKGWLSRPEISEYCFR